MDIARRDFLKGAGAAAGMGMACFSSLAFADGSQPAAGVPETWDIECDVVVIGSGSVTPAALKAHDEGLDVIILEKHPTFFGGTTAFSGGGYTCPNSAKQVAAGREVPRDELLDFIHVCAEGQGNEDVIQMVLDYGPESADYLENECGMPLNNPAGAAWNAYRYVPGYDEKYGDRACWLSVDPHPDGYLMGRAFQHYFMDAVEARQIPVYMGTAAKHLIYDGNPMLDDGQVVGVWAEGPDGPLAIKARYGVVIGTGGFDNNPDMMKSFISAPVYATCAIRTNTGDGHLMAMEVGAEMRNMHQFFHQTFNMIEPDVYTACDETRDTGMIFSEAVNPIQIWGGFPGSIMVNRKGRRFTDDASSYEYLTRGCASYNGGTYEYENVPFFHIMDTTYNGNMGQGTPQLSQIVDGDVECPEWLHKFDTLEELAEGMGIDKDGLLDEVERFNGFCETGVDEDFHRGLGSWDWATQGDTSRVESGEIKNPCLAPLTDGPFYCYTLYPGSMQTRGGMVINGNSQVLNVRGNVIPRLYAASCCTAHVFGDGYVFGGGTLVDGFIPGYVAGKHIATLQPWE